MSETATYKQSTFNATEQKLEQFEQQEAQQPSTNGTTPEQPNELVVNNEEAPLNGAEGAQETPESPNPETQEGNVSDFDLGEVSQSQDEADKPDGGAQDTRQFDWKSELKKLDKKEVAKELGLSDFSLEIDEYLSKGGSAYDYIAAKGVNWNNISDVDLIKQDIKDQFPDATAAQIDRLYNKKYNQHEDTLDEDKEDGLLLMKADAKRIRDTKINTQNSFKIPEAIIPQVKDEAYEQWKKERDAQPEYAQRLSDFYKNHEATKALNESKRVTINLGEGVPPFNFSVNNPEALSKMYTDGGELWQRLTSTESGEPDVQKQYLIGLVAHNPQKFVQDIFNYGIQRGRKSMVDEGHNATRPSQKAMPQEMNQTSYGVGKYGDRSRN